MDTNYLTPIQNIDGLLLKRDDLYTPFGVGDVNGGKLRQCMMLLESVLANKEYKEVVTCCSIHSPQAPITAACCSRFNIECKIYYGGTSYTRLADLSMPLLARYHGAHIEIIAKSGRHTILYAKAKEYALNNNGFIVEYGINLSNNGDILLNAISAQVKNIPDNLDNLIITCGSGITSTGILIGLKQYEKTVKNVYLVGVAPNRVKKISKMLRGFNTKGFKYIDLFNQKGFLYEKEEKASLNDIIFHPNYEAKVYNWLINKSNIDFEKEKTLFWVTGSKPNII